jgi:hypothetical protein
MRTFGLGLTALLLATSASAQTDPTAVAKSAEVKAMIASMAHDITPTEDMLYRTLLTLAPYTVAIEDFGAGDVIEVERPDKKRFMVPMNLQAVPEWNDERLVVDEAFVT